MRAIDALPARELAGTDGALAPFWSPDSQFVGFFARQQLKIVSLLGEPPSTLCDVQSGHIFAPSATWNHDGVILFSQADAIFRIASTGGKTAAVTLLDAHRGETAHILPHFLPDGRHFTYLARGTPGGSINSWVVLGSLDGSEHRQLIRTSSQSFYAEPGYLLFLRDGALLAQPFDAARLRLTDAPRPVPDVDHVGFNPATPRGMFSISQTGLLA
jgi:eukaryotic-like serine/threonine-protein kinase